MGSSRTGPVKRTHTGMASRQVQRKGLALGILDALVLLVLTRQASLASLHKLDRLLCLIGPAARSLGKSSSWGRR